ncbi:MAG: hypothetical protein FJ308_07490 [Planctomycetes bacterium]|nr:hypothetical protein [Planctomycetota bacterium]
MSFKRLPFRHPRSHRANLRRANLRRANLRRANLRRANLRRARLSLQASKQGW